MSSNGVFTYRLGKQPATHDDRDLKMGTVMAGVALPKPPSRFGHGAMFRDWQMLGNDMYGDCVFAGAAHETMMTNKLAGRDVPFDDTHVLRDYGAVTGFTPTNPNSDQGTNVRDALKYRRAVGVQDENGKRHRIGAYVAITPGDFDELMQAVFVFSAVGIGLEFPNTAMAQFNNHEPWDVVAGAKIDGGHYVPVVGRASKNVGTCVTWARRQTFTRDFYATYCDEAWAIVFPEELVKGRTERGFDLAGLNAALKSI